MNSITLSLSLIPYMQTIIKGAFLYTHNFLLDAFSLSSTPMFYVNLLVAIIATLQYPSLHPNHQNKKKKHSSIFVIPNKQSSSYFFLFLGRSVTPVFFHEISQNHSSMSKFSKIYPTFFQNSQKYSSKVVLKVDG